MFWSLWTPHTVRLFLRILRKLGWMSNRELCGCQSVKTWTGRHESIRDVHSDVHSTFTTRPLSSPSNQRSQIKYFSVKTAVTPYLEYCEIRMNQASQRIANLLLLKYPALFVPLCWDTQPHETPWYPFRPCWHLLAYLVFIVPVSKRIPYQ